MNPVTAAAGSEPRIFAASKIGLIWAQSRNRVIGRDGALPWHLPEDLAHFKKTTAGCPVVMGRKTWESLPERFRPLPGRLNVVLTRTPAYSAPGALVAPGLGEAVLMLQVALGAAGSGLSGNEPAAERIWVIGGSQLYEAALPYADLVVVTKIDIDVDGDVFAPELTRADWAEWSQRTAERRTSTGGVKFEIVTWSRDGVEMEDIGADEGVNKREAVFKAELSPD